MMPSSRAPAGQACGDSISNGPRPPKAALAVAEPQTRGLHAIVRSELQGSFAGSFPGFAGRRMVAEHPDGRTVAPTYQVRGAKPLGGHC
jgi:hypothetical protein